MSTQKDFNKYDINVDLDKFINDKQAEFVLPLDSKYSIVDVLFKCWN